MILEWSEIFAYIILGFVAGALGGLIGIGGSLVIIPVMTVFLGKDQHLSQAAAMIVNVFVAAPSVYRHQQAKAVRWDVTWKILPFGVVFIILGVAWSNRLPGELLGKIFGGFLIYVVAYNLVKLFGDGRKTDSPTINVGWAPIGVVGTAMGFMSGLLGIGGGPITVPLLQRLGKLPLRQCIAVSAAVMCLTATIGAWRKNAAIGDITDAAGNALSLQESLIIAVCLAPTAIIGALLGARLTHTLPLRFLRLAFILLMTWVSVNMLGLV